MLWVRLYIISTYYEPPRKYISTLPKWEEGGKGNRINMRECEGEKVDSK